MVFSSAEFLFLFLPCTLLIYYNPVFRGRKFRNVFLLLVSLFFYAWGEQVYVLLLLASIAVNWWLGRYLTRFQDRRWFPFSPESLRKAEGWYHRYGRWTLLCSWMPVIGDPLTLVAGTLREPLPSFLLLVVLAKLGRYLVVAGVALALW